MRGRLGATIAIVALSGCNRVFGLVGDLPTDADVNTDGARDELPDSCATSYTVTPLEFPLTFSDATISSDGHEIYVVDSGFLYRSEHDSSGFLAPTVVFELFGCSDVADPNLSDDGLTLVFVATRSMFRAVYQARRPSVQSAWMVDGPVYAATNGGIDLSADGNTLWWVSGTGGTSELYSRTRISRADQFAGDSDPVAMGVLFPSVSSNELTVWHHDLSQNVVFRARMDPADNFGNPTQALDNSGRALRGSNIDLTHDGALGVYQPLGQALALLTRVCD